MFLLCEEWRDVSGFPSYQVSDQGQVRSRLGRNGDVLNEWHFLKLYTPKKPGYSVVNMKDRDGITAHKYVHRLVLETFVGPAPKGAQCRHFPDRSKTNNSLSNLQWGTPKENCADQKEHGTAMVGGRNHQTKLSVEQVVEMRKLRDSGFTYKQIGDAFNVQMVTARLACIGKNWAHLTSGLAVVGDNRGETNRNSKLTCNQVLAIRRDYKLGKTKADLAREFGLCNKSIASIITRKSWAHL